MSETTPAQFCPICHAPVFWYPRYPRYVCKDCAKLAVSEDGRPLAFDNESFSGGFVAVYADTGEQYPSHVCYIQGVKCIADEAHMGGIVIQPSE